MEKVDMMAVSFGMVDEFGQKTELNKTLETEAYPDGMTADVLLENFKQFLLAVGYTTDTVERIKYED